MVFKILIEISKTSHLTIITLHAIYFLNENSFNPSILNSGLVLFHSLMIPVKRIMTKQIVQVKVGTTVQEAAQLMKEKSIGSLLIRKEHEILGIVTEMDIVQKVVANGSDASATRVENVMSSPLLTIEPEKSVVDANDLMDQHRVRHLGVTEGDQIVGIVSVRDLLHPLYIVEEEDS